MENWEKSNILTAGVTLFQINFCQESFIRAKIFFSSQIKNQIILIQMKQGLRDEAGSCTSRGGSVDGDL